MKHLQNTGLASAFKIEFMRKNKKRKFSAVSGEIKQQSMDAQGSANRGEYKNDDQVYAWKGALKGPDGHWLMESNGAIRSQRHFQFCKAARGKWLIWNAVDGCYEYLCVSKHVFDEKGQSTIETCKGTFEWSSEDSAEVMARLGINEAELEGLCLEPAESAAEIHERDNVTDGVETADGHEPDNAAGGKSKTKRTEKPHALSKDARSFSQHYKTRQLLGKISWTPSSEQASRAHRSSLLKLPLAANQKNKQRQSL